jgi:hypothetical protein
MDVIGFLCISLGRRTAQLHDNLGSRRACSQTDFSSQNGDRPEDCTTEEQHYVVRFCRQKDSKQRIFIKKCFLFTVGSVCRVKRSQLGREILSRAFESRRWCTTRCGSGWGNSQKTSMLRVSSTGKAMGQVYQCLWKICREINVFSRFEYHMSYVLHPSATYLLTFPRI